MVSERPVSVIQAWKVQSETEIPDILYRRSSFGLWWYINIHNLKGWFCIFLFASKISDKRVGKKTLNTILKVCNTNHSHKLSLIFTCTLSSKSQFSGEILVSRYMSFLNPQVQKAMLLNFKTSSPIFIKSKNVISITPSLVLMMAGMWKLKKKSTCLTTL